MKVVVASDIPIGSHRAHAINVFKTAGGFARLGHEVLVCCRAGIDGAGPADARGLYGESELSWRLAPGASDPSPAGARAFGEWVVEAASAWGVDMLYARHFEAALCGVDAGMATVLETHAYIGDMNPALQRAIEATARGGLSISTISHRLAAHYVERGGVESRIRVVPDGVDIELFVRRDHGIDPFGGSARPRVLYAGHLYDYKGVPTLIEAAREVEGEVHLLGGTDEDIERVRRRVASSRVSNVHVHGRVAHAQVAPWLWHADVLVLPPSGREASCAWTSPVKLGEYLASGTPIVASSIPALRDWVDESVVTWFEADDASSLACAIGRVLSRRIDRRRVEAALRCAARFSYSERASAMLELAVPSVVVRD